MASGHHAETGNSWRWIIDWHNLVPIAMALVLAAGWDHHERQSAQEADQQYLNQTLARLRSDMERTLNSRLLLVRGLAATIKARPDLSARQFADFVHHLADGQGRIRSLQWAPKAVVAYVHPVEGNEAAIGHDLLTDPDRRAMAEQAIRDRQFIVTGPVNLRQGGTAIVARLPLYTGGPSLDPMASFAGFVSIVLDMDTLYADMDLARYEAELRIAIRGRDGLGSHGEAFYGDPQLFGRPDAETTEIQLPHGNWQVGAELREPMGHYPGRDRAVLALVVLLAIGTVLFLNRRVARSESALKDSEARLKEMATSLGEGVYVIDDQGRIAYANPKACQLLGWSERDLIGRDAAGLCRNADQACCPSEHCHVIHRALSGESFRSEDVELVCQDGSALPVELNSSPIVRDDRQVGAVVAFNDITERKRAAAALARSEARLREAQRVANIGHWDLDLTSGALTWSDEVYAIFELDAAAVSPSYEGFLERVHPDDRAKVDHAYQTSLKSRRPYEITHRLLMADGTVKYVLERCESTFAADGTPLRSIGTVQDITERVLHEQSVKESEERFRTIADHTYDWEYWLGPGHEFLYISPSCQRVTGYSQAEFISKPCLLQDIVHADDRELIANHLADLECVEDVAMEFRIQRKDGEIRWLAHGCRPIYAKDGRFLGRRASNRDITDRKEAEAQIQQLAYFDPLTGLPNRRMLMDRLNHDLSQARRHDRSLAVMFLDLDGFKQINDSLGHDVGDALLKEIGHRLADCVRSGDTVSRQGGDEFVIVLAEITQPEDAIEVARKIIAVVAAPATVCGHDLQVTTSIGVAVLPVGGTDGSLDLMKKADQAMYAAKEAGRNRYRLYGSDEP